MKNTYPFIVRIWLEPCEGQEEKSEYRGVIEPVGEGEKVHFCDVRQISEYFAEFLAKQGIIARRPRGIWRRLRGKG